MPARAAEDIFIAVTYVPLENNYYTRRLEDNRVVLSYFGLHEEIVKNNIPIENLLLRVLYECGIVYYCEKGIPSSTKAELSFLHDDTRGCIFDMNGNKLDVVYSLDRPVLCSGCMEGLRQNRVSEEIIGFLVKDLCKIRKNPYWRIVNFIKSHPVLSLAITAVSGIIISVTANYLYGLIETLFSGMR